MFEVVRVRDVMAPLPLTIDVEQTLAEARARMLQLGVRHLPVLAGERVVGMLSERDISLAAGLGLATEEVSVGTAMSAGPFTVRPEEPLAAVVSFMAEHKLGSAVVLQNGRVVGVFTSTDALRLLSRILKHSRALEPIELTASSVVERLQKEQSILTSIKQASRITAVAALNGDQSAMDQLPSCSQGLDRAVLRYIELEEDLLVPLLLEASDEGAIRAELLREQHQKERRQIQMARLALLDSDPEHLASAVLNVCAA